MKPGDLVRVLEDVRLESGTLLRRDQNAQVETVIEGNPLVGIKWRDGEGTHVLAVERERLELVP